MRAAVLPALLAAVLLGGCSSAVSGTPLPAAASTDPSAATDPAAAAPGSAPVSATAQDDPSAAAADPASGEFCAAARANVALLPGLTDALAGNGDLAAVVARIKRSNATVEAAAPAEIKADVAAAYALSDKELDLIAHSGGDPSTLLQDPAFRQAVADAGAATTRLSTYLTSHCGIDISSLLGGLGG